MKSNTLVKVKANNMNKLLLILLLIFTVTVTNAQEMNNEKLHSIIYTLSDKVEGTNGSWKFIIDSTLFICLTDELHNRMRIISPIDQVENLSNEQIMRCMEANFHTALDVRYSVSDQVLWSAFIHPLKELTKEQVISGMSQVYSCVKTFGSTYSSGTLNFPTNEERNAQQN